MFPGNMKACSLALTTFSLVITLALLSRTCAFTSTIGNSPIRHLVTSTSFRTQPVYIFGRNKDGDESSRTESGEPRKLSVPFFGRLGKQKEDSDDGPVTAVLEEQVVATLPKVTETPKEPLDSLEQAKVLRAQAERARLEAERMDASLTLSKIDRLERQLKDAKKKGESIDELQRQLDNLQAKLRGEAPKPAVTRLKLQVEETDGVKGSNVASEITTKKDRDVSKPLQFQRVLGSEDFEEMKWLVQNSPVFVQKLIADMVEVDYDSVDDLNTTEVVSRLTMAQDGNFSYSGLSKPIFTDEEIEGALRQVANSEVSLPKSLVASFGDDKRKLAEYVLKSQYYLYDRSKQTFENEIASLFNNGDNEEALKELAALLNTTVLDRLISNNYPECMRKEDSTEPTLSQVQLLASTVLPLTKFKASSKPEKVNGGFIIQGTYTYDSGNALIEAIDKELAKVGLSDKLTVLLTDDFVAVSKLMETDEEITMGLGQNESPMLYITGPDVVRDSKPVPLSLVSGLGLATTWYFSIYPFLLNPNLSKRVEEQLSVADAGMNYDLAWLTDLSVPLFAAFLGLQVLHEAGHRIVARANDVKLSPPTLVPSLVTGITSSVTSFKSLPKTKEAMFDVAASGPLLGYVASVAALVIGAQLSLTSDPSTMPALPVDILRQSTLGGSVVDSIIQGSLYVPEGADSSGLMVSLHPLAVAGYVSMIVNALALLPVGTTDGGRMALALFGRNTKTVIGYLTMATLLFTGVFGSDLFLFYFAFIIVFQKGNEVPARNEFDEIDISRIVVGGLGFVLAFLTLVPVQ